MAILSENDVVLRDGSVLQVRPVQPGDEGRLLAFFRGLSAQSRSLRFFSPAVDVDREAHRAMQAGPTTCSLVAVTGPTERVVGHAVYAGVAPGRAEVALAVADEYQGRGLGTAMLGRLAAIAAANGVAVFEAEVLPENYRMIDVFRQSGFPLELHARPGQLHLTFPTVLTEEGVRAFERREQIAAAQAVATFFTPRSVAVIGASRERGSPGGELFHNLLASEFAGPVYPVNPFTPQVQSVAAYPSVAEVPGPVDLAVVAVPAAHVEDVAEQCARKGVRALLVISAGFAEAGEEGRARQARLLRICRQSGMRLVGPNCMGLINTDPAVRLSATFAPHVPPPGRVGFASQSGGLGLAAIEYASAALGLGFSQFISTGNKADISGNDLLSYWEADPRTDVILLYVESFGNPRKFGQLARQIGRSKPIAVVKSGRFPAGARATSSHTGSLLAGSDMAADALFHQAGVIRAGTVQELFDVAQLLVSQPLPKGRRVGIVTNVGGPAILCADACEAAGLEVPLLTEETRRQLRGVLPPQASTANPVDMIASASAADYGRVIRAVAADANVDSVIAIFIPPLATREEEVAATLAAAEAEMRGKPLLAVFMSSRGAPPGLRTPGFSVPAFPFPESAAVALAHAARHGEWRQRGPGRLPRFEGLRRDRAASLVAEALGRGGGWLGPAETAELLGCYGLPLAPARVAATPEAAGQAAQALGGRVALKACAPGLVHKSDVGGVRLGLQGAAEVRQAAQMMEAHLREQGIAATGFLIQTMVPQGVEMIVGVVQDPQFGPVVACGAGGTLVEVLHDASLRLAPLTHEDAAEMVRGLKSYRLLTGFRGDAPRDVAALEDALLRLSALADDLPQVAELDCNPVVVLHQGAVVVDARVRLAQIIQPTA